MNYFALKFCIIIFILFWGFVLKLKNKSESVSCILLLVVGESKAVTLEDTCQLKLQCKKSIMCLMPSV